MSEWPCWVTVSDDLLRQVILDEDDLCRGGEVPITVRQREAAVDALEAAQEILTRLTGGVIHGPGQAVDEYVVGPAGVRLASGAHI